MVFCSSKVLRVNRTRSRCVYIMSFLHLCMISPIQIESQIGNTNAVTRRACGPTLQVDISCSIFLQRMCSIWRVLNSIELFSSGTLWCLLITNYEVRNRPAASVSYAMSNLQLATCVRILTCAASAHGSRKPMILSDSGYPIVTHLDAFDPQAEGFLLNSRELEKKGAWGLFHEIGHNMHRDWWSKSRSHWLRHRVDCTNVV